MTFITSRDVAIVALALTLALNAMLSTSARWSFAMTLVARVALGDDAAVTRVELGAGRARAIAITTVIGGDDDDDVVDVVLANDDEEEEEDYRRRGWRSNQRKGTTRRKPKTRATRIARVAKRVSVNAIGGASGNDAQRKDFFKRNVTSLNVGAIARDRSVIVIVTSDFRCACYDAATLDALWTTRGAGDDFMTSAPREGKELEENEVVVREASIAITRARVRENDIGLVVVGARVERRRRRDEYANATEDELLGGFSGKFSGEMEYIAFEGATGDRRWIGNDGETLSRVGRSSRPTIDGDEASGDASERACREFKTSAVRDGLPHFWRDEGDTTMSLAHFRRDDARVKRDDDDERRRKKSLSSLKVMKQNVALPTGVARALSRVVETLHGAPKTAVKRVPFRVRKEEPPNVVVSHHADGVDVLHLYSGRRICAMDLASPGLHVDLDGDGVVDHVEAHGWHSRAENVPQCWATVTTTGARGERERVLSASICRGGSGMHGHRAAIEAGFDHRHVHVVPPVSLRRLPETAAELARPLDAMGRDAIFLNNRGDLTCYNMRDGARKRWQLNTAASWHDDGVVVPSLTAFPARVGGYVDFAAAVGERSIVFVDAKGRRAAPTIDLTAPPTSALVARDVDGDGLTDIILRTRSGTYVWRQTPKRGGAPFAFLLGLLCVTVTFAFATQLKEASERASTYGGRVRLVRSTSLAADDDEDEDDDDDDDDDIQPRARRDSDA